MTTRTPRLQSEQGASGNERTSARALYLSLIIEWRFCAHQRDLKLQPVTSVNSHMSGTSVCPCCDSFWNQPFSGPHITVQKPQEIRDKATAQPWNRPVISFSSFNKRVIIRPSSVLALSRVEMQRAPPRRAWSPHQKWGDQIGSCPDLNLCS